MVILVTGVKGFVGSHIFSDLQKEHEVIGLARSSDQSSKIYSSEDLHAIPYEPEVVIVCHAAVSSGTNAASSFDLYKSNVELTELLTKRFKSSFFVYVSTVSIYEKTKHLINELSKVQPQNEYACSKLWAENIVLNNTASCVIRLSSVYGVGMKENTIIPRYVKQAIHNKEISVWGNGSRTQNYIHVLDVCEKIKKIVRNKEKLNKKILLGVAPIEYSNLELAKMICEVTNAKINMVNEDDSLSVRYDGAYTNNILGISNHTNFSKGVKDYISWFLKY